MEERRSTLAGLLTQLQADGVISADARRRALHAASPDAQSLRQHPLLIIAEAGLPDCRHSGCQLTRSSLLHWLSQRYAQPVVDIDPLQIDIAATTAVVSAAFARRHQIIVLTVDSQQLLVASADPEVTGWEKILAQTARRRIVRAIADPSAIARCIEEFYCLSNALASAEDSGVLFPRLTSVAEARLDIAEADATAPGKQQVVEVVDWLLRYAFSQRASDIHIESRREQGVIRLRIDGLLCPISPLPMSIVSGIVCRLKILARMDLSESRRPQDGRIKTVNAQGVEVELRLSTIPTAYGEKVVLRIFDPLVLQRDFSQLGLDGESERRWSDMSRQSGGILLVTGPTGSGKTTTLYATLQQLSSVAINICSIEDPIELLQEDFNQIQVQENIGLSFSVGLRALMRQDPDIIMVGEIRDRETAEVAVQAALTGHLIISTLHTHDACSAVFRLLELGIPAYLLRATLIGVMAQRLLRTLCVHCKSVEQIGDSTWHLLTAPRRREKPSQVFRAAGCNHCRQSGYTGRLGIYEVLPVRGLLEPSIVEHCDLTSLRRKAVAAGIRPLPAAGAEQVASGITSVEEVLRVSPVIQPVAVDAAPSQPH